MTIKSIKILFLLAVISVSAGNSFAQQSLSLSDAIQRALENNYDIRVSEKNKKVAAINNNWGTAGRLPSINFSANSLNSRNNKEQDDYTSNILNGGVAVNWTLFNGFAVNITKARLNDLEAYSKGNAAVIVEGTIQSVILAYHQVLLEKNRLKVMETLMNLSKDRFDYEKTRQEIGSAVTFDVLQAQNSYLEDKANLLAQKVNLKSAIRDLNFLMAETKDVQWNFPDTFKPEQKEYMLADLKDKMLSSNATIKNQFINQRLLGHELAMSRSTYMPKLSLNAGADARHTRLDYDTAGEVKTDSWDYYGNLTLSYNLYSGGTRNRAVQIAKINESIGELDLEALQHSLTNQMLNLYAFHEVRQELLTVKDEALDAAKLNLQIAEEKFKSGAINSFNYRDVQLIFLNASLSQLQAVYDLIDSDVSLMRITGGIISEYTSAEAN